MKRKQIAIFLLCLVFITVLVAGCGESEPTIDDKKSFAWSAAENEVEQQLKSPSTAKFQWYDSDNVKQTEEEDVFLVKAYVDSENGFGAMIRTNYIAKIKVNYERETYTLLDIAFE